MFEDDGCAAFGALGGGGISLGRIGEIDGEPAEVLAERWAVRYPFSVTRRRPGSTFNPEKKKMDPASSPG